MSNSPQSSQPPSRSEALVHRLIAAGVILHLTQWQERPHQEERVAELADALLAAPALAILVPLHILPATGAGPSALEVIAAVRQRGREHLLVGASNIRSTRDVEQAIAAGAQFLLAPYFQLELFARAHALDLPYIPGVLTAGEAAAATRAGLRHVCLFPADIFGPDHLRTLAAGNPGLIWLAAGGIQPTEVAPYRRAGASALIVELPHFRGQAELITLVRMMNRIWEGTS